MAKEKEARPDARAHSAALERYVKAIWGVQSFRNPWPSPEEKEREGDAQAELGRARAEYEASVAHLIENYAGS